MCCGLVPGAHSATVLELLSLERYVEAELLITHFR